MIKADFIHYNLIFNLPSGTSRGILTEKPSYIIKVWDEKAPEIVGLGEVSLILGLSPENPQDVTNLLKEFLLKPELFYREKELSKFPALKFGIETAFLDLQHGGKQVLFPSKFTQGNSGIQINGLVWMDDKDTMLKRIKEKVNQGFSCIKIKVGAIDFEEELNLLKYIRKTYSTKELEIRVDANGAFTKQNALLKLNALSKFGIHSIEQPIKQGQWSKMAALCKNTPIPIALDEELIGITHPNDRENMLETIKPQYIILKPSLIGGLEEANKWSNLAMLRNIGWWVTSALEGNIGLNAIAQWTFLNGSKMPQGLGTGQIFSNNLESPLEIRGEQLWYNPNLLWNFDGLGFQNSTPVLRTPTQGGEGTQILGGKKEINEFESPKNIPTGIPLMGLPERRGWNKNLATKENNYHYNPKLKERATYHRKHATKAEACLWKYALNKRPMGFQFTRQRPVLNYIADFMCTELMLIIEVDGATHFMDDLPNNDAKRQRDLEEIGFTVFRFEDKGVLKNMSGIQTVLEQFMNEFLKAKDSTPVLRTPPPGGDRTLKLDGKEPSKYIETDIIVSPENIPTGIPLMGVPERRGWNITLDNVTYDLKTTDWNSLKTLNNRATWWLDIVGFLELWTNSSTTLELKTSGSTGDPKIMVVEKAKMWVSASKTCQYFQLNETSTGLLCLSANYIAGKMMLVRAMVSGMNLICIEPTGNPVKGLKTPLKGVK